MDRLRAWFAAQGGSFHPAVVLDPQGPYGVSVLAPRLDGDTTIVTCPFSLVITRDVAAQALKTLLGPDAHAPLDAWSERQLICTYLCAHHLCSEQSCPEVLRHLTYVQCLPPAENLSTPLHFTPAEREMLRGTNLYGATLDRERDWKADWAQCRSLVRSLRPAWGDAFSWDMYLTASTHLSCRAFPSSMLSPNPSLVVSSASYPVLIPCVDLLNHKRGQPVSWIVSRQDDDSTTPNAVSIVVHPKSDPDPPSELNQKGLFEVFNNYGLKPNDELVLGYGFSLPDNPDDTITLQVGGAGPATPQKWVVGRHAQNAQGLWSEVKRIVGDGNSDCEFEDDLETAATLSDMVRAKLGGIRTVADVRRSDGVRPAVRIMLEHYITGQREILESILEFLNEKREAAIDAARKQGIDLVFDEDDDDRA